jgi:AraC-like DNA-binding protein
MDHDYYSDATDPWIKYWFNVEGTLVDHLVQAYGLGEVFHVESAGDALLRVYREGVRESRKHYLRQDKSGVHETVALIVHRILAGLAAAAHVSTGSDVVRRMKEYIDGHFAGPVSLSDISRAAGRSSSQAIRLFRQETGKTPYDYLLARRVNEAGLLLRDTRFPVKAIAARLGFCDEYHFSATFKRRTGESPRAFRKKA